MSDRSEVKRMPKDIFNKGKIVNDGHSQLNRTRVSEIICPQSVEETRQTVKRALEKKLHISVAGKKHSMGGQQFLTDGILLDMSAMNRVINFEPEKQLIEVEAGISWNELIDFTVSEQKATELKVGIRQKQTGADDLTLGGALASNIHGRGLTMKPIIDDIESFKIVTATGEVLECSRVKNYELFRIAIGGYGLFGIIVSIKLRLMQTRKLKRIVSIEEVENLPELFAKRIENNFLYGDFQFSIDENSPDFLNRGVFSCYQPVSDDTPIAENNVELSPESWENLLFLAHTNKQKAFELYAAHYLKTNGQIYLTDTHQTSFYLENYHQQLDSIAGKAHSASEMITEIYVPLDKLGSFLQTVREDFRLNSVNLIYGTIRIIKRDDESFLAWAREDFACIVFNLHIEHQTDEVKKAEVDFRRLIDSAIIFGGSFYLTYHAWATVEQIQNCYPQFREFLDMKLKYDGAELFQSNWQVKYKKLFNKKRRTR
jgi:hypothetical protein